MITQKVALKKENAVQFDEALLSAIVEYRVWVNNMPFSVSSIVLLDIVSVSDSRETSEVAVCERSLLSTVTYVVTFIFIPVGTESMEFWVIERNIESIISIPVMLLNSITHEVTVTLLALTILIDVLE